MAKGVVARNVVEKTIQSAFGENYVGVDNKKIYVEAADDSGELVQFAITITMTKTPIKRQDNDLTDASVEEVADAPRKAVELSEDEKKKVEDLLKKLEIEVQ